MILHQSFASVDLDRQSLIQSDLDIDQRVRTNPLPWTGQFSPQLVEQLLSAYAPRNGILLDPFVGSGTSLIEAARLGIAASGTELNPAAVILSSVYHLINQSVAKRLAAIDHLDRRIFDFLAPSIAPLFAKEPQCLKNRSSLEKNLIDLWRDSTPDPEKALAAALIVLCDFYQNRLDASTIQLAWNRLCHTVKNLPHSKKPISVVHADARSLPLSDRSIDFVLTSPPYINVHNYHQQYRRSIEALAYDVLAIAPSEIGSNRKNRGNRFLTVIQYALDIALSLREVVRTTRPGSLSIFVLGRESTVRGVRFFNGELVAEVATQAVGMQLERRQERVFRNRYGKQIYEDILHFRSTGEIPDEKWCISEARRIAGQVLSKTRILIAPHREKPMIDDALAKLHSVSPSPILSAQHPSNIPS